MAACNCLSIQWHSVGVLNVLTYLMLGQGHFKRCTEVEATWEYGRKGEKEEKYIN